MAPRGSLPPTVRREGDAAVIVPTGALDIGGAPLLERELEALASVPLVIVDLRSVEFIDSTGLNALLRGHQWAMDSGREFAVVRGNEQGQRLMSLTGVADVLTLVDKPEELLRIEVERVDFVSVPTRDLARSRRFYGEVLGLPRSRSNLDEFEAGNVTLTLWQPEAQDVPFSPNTAGIALRVPDVNVARERLAAKGVESLGDTVDTGVCLMSFLHDPDGNVLILHRRYAPVDG